MLELIKVILFIGIFISSTYLGFSFSQVFIKRYENLKELQKLIIFMENQVLYVNTPLPEAIEATSAKETGVWRDVFLMISKDLRENNVDDVHEAFTKSLELYKNQLYLKNSDIDIILNFSKSLGVSGIFGQEKIFSLFLSNIKEQINEAKDLKNKNCKMYKCLGISLGAAIIILLI